MNELNRIKSKLKAGEPVIGTCVNLGDSSITELLGSIGYDFIWIDMEHTGNDKMDIQHHIIAAKAAGAASFVRIPWNDPVLAKPILDMGPDGIIFPFIRSVEEARQAIKSCIYPPKGLRGFNPIRAVRYGIDNVSEYINDVQNRIFKMIQIEHIDAVNCMEEIIKIEGIDALIVGPMDLSGSLGKLGKIRDKEVLKVMDRIGEIAIKSNIPLGLAIGYSPIDIKEWIDRGIKFISVNGDTGFLTDAGKENLNQTRRLFGI
jgi:2-keto-3-deoxy-L-rhamnonate aldolase RhmA